MHEGSKEKEEIYKILKNKNIVNIKDEVGKLLTNKIDIMDG